MRLLIEACFRIPALNRLYLHTLDWNARARRGFSKCGFRELRPVQRSGKSFIFMELLRTEWEAMGTERIAAKDTADGR
jgi:RimJ/RimL family protein N-acetyltransferase